MPSSAADAAGLLRARSPTRARWCSSRTSRCTSAASRAARSRPSRSRSGRADRSRGQRRHDRRDLADGRRGARRPPSGSRERGDRGRGDRSAHACPARPRHDRRVGAPHRAGRWSRTRRLRPAGSAPSSPPGSQAAAFDYLEAPIQRVGAPFAPVPVSPPLEDAYRPGATEIHAAAQVAIEWGWPDAEPLGAAIRR